MKKTQMFFYAAAVVGFYFSLALLFTNVASVTGLSLLCMSILMLVIGVFIQWRSANHIWEQNSCVASEGARMQVSC